MDELDKKLYYTFNKDEEIPKEFPKVIQEALKNCKANKKHSYYSIARIITTACASLLITTGIVYAGATISNYIWKQPEKTVGFYDENNKGTITKEEQESAISEDEAIEKSKNLLEKFGYINEKIKSSELINNSQDYNLIWKIETYNGISIDIDSKNGNYFAISYDENKLLNKDSQNCKVTREEAEEKARDLCKKYGYDLEKYNKVYIEPHSYEDVWNGWDGTSNHWHITFSKTYDDGINSYENIRMSFITGSEITELYYFMLEDAKTEDNPIVITEEEAKQIALDAEKKINTGYEIKNIYANLDIALMNGRAYERMTNYEQYCKQYYGDYLKDFSASEIVTYRTDSIVRNVWMVTIENDGVTDTGKYVDKYFTYYVDRTTGEIIGGSEIYYLLKLQNE